MPRDASFVTVGSKPVGPPIAPGFVGFSFEFTALPAYTGADPTAINPLLVRLIREVSPTTAPILRIGGDSTDWTWWPDPQISRPAGIKYELTDQWLALARGLAQETGGRLIVGINLEADNAALAATEAQAIEHGIGAQRIEALEIGNEPELYGSFNYYLAPDGLGFPGRPRDWDFERYLPDLANIASGVQGARLAGPAVGVLHWMTNLGALLKAQPRVRIVTMHRYPLLNCFAPRGTPQYPTLAHLLSLRASEGLAQSVARYTAIAHASGASVRIDEMNSVACGGRPGLSNSFASALWAVDALFSMARVGVDGVNFHTFPGAAYAPFEFTQTATGWRATVSPLYYGLLLFSEAAPAGARLLPVGVQHSTVRAWATRASDRHIRVVLINDDLFHSRVEAIRVRGVTGDAKLALLRAPKVLARSGVELAGQSFGTSTTTGLLDGTSRLRSVPPAVGGAYVVTVPPASAALLTVTEAGARSPATPKTDTTPTTSTPTTTSTATTATTSATTTTSATSATSATTTTSATSATSATTTTSTG